MKSRTYSFTINNDTYEDLYNLVCLPFRYLCFGFEVGKKGTHHIQGYIYYDNARHFESVKKDLPCAHIEISKGTPTQNIDYTKKDGEWYEFGDIPHQGQAQWDKIEDVMKDPHSNPHLYNQYSKMYRQITMSTKKDHERKLYIVNDSIKYEFIKQYDTVYFDHLEDTYDGEQCIVHTCYHARVDEWIHGYPTKIKRGYELICVDPEVAVITYLDNKERNYLIKKYLEYIDGVQDEIPPEGFQKEDISQEDNS